MSKLLSNKTGFTRAPLFKKFKNGAGFTLIEAMIAIIILIIGLLAVIQLFPFSLQVIGDSQNITTASNIALAKIEELESLSYDDVSTGIIEIKQRVSSDPTSYLYHYQRQLVVETVDPNLNPSVNDNGLKKITVTVFWQSPIGSTEKSIQLTTLIAKY